MDDVERVKQAISNSFSHIQSGGDDVLTLRAKAAIAALTAAGWQKIGPGQVVVPRELTEEMTKAAVWSLDKAREKDGKFQERRPYTPQEKHAIRYRAMLAAILKEADNG